MSDKFIYDKIEWKVPVERSLLINTEIDHPSMRLYLILLSYARSKVTAFPSRETLAKDMGCGVRNVDLLKNKLKDNNLLSWTTKFYGQKKHNTYYLLQYKPIKSGFKKQKIASGTGNILPVNNNKPNNKTTSSRFEKVVNSFTESYKKICAEIDPQTKQHVQSGWIHNPHYTITNGDRRNLNEFYNSKGESGLKKMEVSFKYLSDYIEDKIQYGNFYNTDGSELVPTISLFLKSKIQYDGLMEWTTDELRRKLDG